MLMSMPLVARAGVDMGDANGDGAVNISDITLMVSYVLTGDATNLNLASADVNGDGVVNISDVTGLVSAVLTGTPITPPSQEGDWVDLGLPSGTLWATCNVGASSPEEYGDYFAWGETTPNKRDYYQAHYKWWKNGFEDAYGYWHHSGYTKYCTGDWDGYDGFVDNKTELELEDDAAYVNWGPSWRMPSYDQILELAYNCTWQWTQRNGVNGQLVTGSNGNTMFLPAAGCRWKDSKRNEGSEGYCWSYTLSTDSDNAYCLGLSLYGWGIRSGYTRYDGCTVRPVRVP